MKKLNHLLKKLTPFEFLFLLRGKETDTLVKEIVQKSEFYINRINNINYYSELNKLYEKVITEFVEALADVKSPEFIINNYKLQLKSYLTELEEFKTKLLHHDEGIILYAYQTHLDFIGLSETSYWMLNDDERYSDSQIKKYSELSKEHKKEIDWYFEFNEYIVNKITKQVQYLSVLPDTTSHINKIKLNLSVGEIALLFRFLYDNKTIQPESKEELFRNISLLFKTNRADTISTNSLRKKFHEADDKAVKEIDALLVNLRQLLNKIDK